MQEVKTKFLTECERLCKINIEWTLQNGTPLKKVFKKIEAKKSDTLTKPEKVLLSEFFDARFTVGKIAGMINALQFMSENGQVEIPKEYPAIIEWSQRNFV